MPDDARLSDDDLLQRGAVLETILPTLEQQHTDLQQRLQAEKRKLLKAGARLGLNVGFGSLGILASPITAGLSLVATVGSGGLLAWEVADFSRGVVEARQLARQIKAHRTAVQETADELEELVHELESRTS